jgi:hypothetical protein
MGRRYDTLAIDCIGDAQKLRPNGRLYRLWAHKAYNRDDQLYDQMLLVEYGFKSQITQTTMGKQFFNVVRKVAPR